VRAATSIGANYRAACKARSRADFISKITIVEEEADETQYWQELLMELGKSDQPEITASGKTAKRNR
jgi:four helix bundle protein